MPEKPAYGCVVRHVIPRNPAIPDMSLREVVSSEPIMRNAQGQVVGSPIPLYRGNSPKLSVMSMYSPGTYYSFKLGWLYVMQGPNSPSEWLFGAAKEGAMFAAPGFAELAGPFSQIVEKAMHAVLEEIPTNRSEGKEGALKGTTNDVASELEKRGALYEAGVDLVEIEYHLDPPKFLSKKEWHRCVMTFEKRGGKRTTYSVGWRGVFGYPNVNAVMIDLLAARRDGEFGQLLYLVLAEHVDVEGIARAKVEEYTRRYGDELGAHWPELQADLEATYTTELENKGINEQHAAEIALERLATLIPAYEKIPVMNEAVGILRGIAAGKGESAAS